MFERTAKFYPSCICHLPPVNLEPGIYVADLWMLGSGCTTGQWVCSRLDAIRRHYRQNPREE